MGISNETGGNLTFISLGKTDSDFHGKFVIKDKDKVVKDSFNTLSGAIVDISQKDLTYKGDVNTVVRLNFYDFDEDKEYQLQLGKDSGSFRSLANTLCSLEKAPDLKDIKVRVYMKDEYVNFYTEKKGTKLGWKYKTEELPEPEVTKNKKGKEEKDFTDASNFLYDELIDKILPIAKKTSKMLKGKETNSDNEDASREEKSSSGETDTKEEKETKNSVKESPKDTGEKVKYPWEE